MIDQGALDAVWKEIGEINEAFNGLSEEIDEVKAEVDRKEQPSGWSTFSLVCACIVVGWIAFMAGRVEGLREANDTIQAVEATCGTPV